MNEQTRSAGIAAIALAGLLAAGAAAGQPRLDQAGDVTRLIVEGKPFIVRGGELGNSSASSIDYMATIWPQLTAMNVNTVLMPVYWELIEPEEGRFDFWLVDALIDAARDNDQKIVLLWFGAWKNSMSSYVPPWAKLDEARFPRGRGEDGETQEILTAFAPANLEADKAAFATLMRHLKRVDADDQTVIMVQVENEVGMLPNARDYHPAATERFNDDVPAELMRTLENDELVPEFEARWRAAGRRSSGTWTEVFGEGVETDEIFMAWHYAKFVDSIAAAGKAEYPLPMFVNAALPRPGRQPGTGYPSAGPLPHLMDLWRAGAPSIDFISPDFYNPDFEVWSDLYSRQGNPLFVPEHRFDDTAAAKALFAVGHYEAIGFAPFSIESGGKAQSEALARAYGLIAELEGVITAHHGRGRVEGVLLSKEDPETVIRLGSWELTCRHDYTLGWSPEAAEEEWPLSSAILVQTGDNSFYFAGTGVVVTAAPVAAEDSKAGILHAEEGRFEDGEWRRGRVLNGDQTHQGRHLRIPGGAYRIQRFSLYEYSRFGDEGAGGRAPQSYHQYQ